MANVSAPFGFWQRGGLGSAPTYEQFENGNGGIDYNAGAIYYGDPVLRAGSGDGTLVQGSNAQTVPMGTARNITIPVGNQTRYVRVYSSYGSSPPSSPLYHGGAQPIAVNGGGTDSGPQFLPSEGTGTGPARVGLQGPGQTPFRSKTGAPPVR